MLVTGERHMARYMLVVQTNAVEGRHAEFNEWYDRRHIPDLLALPGVISARRYEQAPDQLGAGLAPMELAPRQFRYLALYEIETDDTTGWIRELMTRVGTARMPVSEALSPLLSAVLWKAR